MDVQHAEWATFLQDVNDRRYQMFRLGWGADYPDPQNFLDILFHSHSQSNSTGYSNPAVDALLEQARVERDQVTRIELYQRIERMILEDAPWVLLWNNPDKHFLVKPNVEDYLVPPMTIPRFRYIHLAK